jgi:RpiB/LacA/LacB family sugar-phosphate isomerase
MSIKKYNLLIPIAGKGQRFIDAGYKVPKQFIYIGRKQLIDLSLECFNYEECNLIFVVRNDQISNYNIDQLLKAKYGKEIKIVVTNGMTDGSVSSCLLAKQYIDNDLPLFIHTLDVQFFPKVYPEQITKIGADGLILTFKSNSSNYSYALMDKNGDVAKTAEKEVISDQACVGIYYFNKGSIFCKNAKEMIERNLRTNNEFYISPLYNLLIEKQLKVKTQLVEKMHIFGTPKEFEFYKNNVVKKIGVKPIALCADHSGYKSKEIFKNILKKKSIDFIDYGTILENNCDYKYFIEQAIIAKKDNVCDFIFGFCRTGQGVNMCANKFENIRAALIYDEFSAEMAIRHNCANFFSFPEKIFYEQEKVEKIIDILLNNSFDGGRHQARIQDLEK